MPRFLHAICGNADKTRTTKLFAQDDWAEVRLDPYEVNKPDVVGSLLEMDKVEAASMDAVITSHSLERLYPHEVIQALENIKRVLKDDGYFIVTCADMQTICGLVAEDKYLDPVYTSSAGPVAPIDMLYGFRPALAAGQLQFATHCGFTSKALTGTLAQVGFASIWAARNPDILTIGAIATKKECTEEELRALADKHFG